MPECLAQGRGQARELGGALWALFIWGWLLGKPQLSEAMPATGEAMKPRQGKEVQIPGGNNPAR